MTIFTRHNSGSRGGVPRGRGRGGGLRGERTGNGRKNPHLKSRAENKNTFHSTRVEQATGEDAIADGDNNSIHSEDAENTSKLSSASEADIDRIIAKPYTSLLSSLSDSVQRGPPQLKKRKLDPDGSSKFEQVMLDAHVDEVLESDEVEGLEEEEENLDIDAIDDINDSEAEQEPGHEHDPMSGHLDAKEDDLIKTKIQKIDKGDWVTAKQSGHMAWSSEARFPGTTDGSSLSISGAIQDIVEIPLKQRLRVPAQKRVRDLDTLTGNLAFMIFHYRDILFPVRTLENSTILRNLTCLHIVNHVFTTRDRILKNNARLARQNAETELELRDQGFTRPKVLVILPTRHSCAKYVESMIALTEPEQQENKKRFEDAFAGGGEVSTDKPMDFRDLFDGNDDDMFRIGLKFTRKTVKFFAQFYNSDIILASPLGLRMALGGDDPRKQDTDFLSSIEIAVLEQADSILMQNWEHVEFIFDRLNLQPKEAHGCDFSRVRGWYLDGNAKFFRQTILFSAFNFPSFNRLYLQKLLNIEGKLKYIRVEEGAMTGLPMSLRQTFSRFDAGSLVAEPDNRFKYFTAAIVPSLSKASRHSAGGGGQGVLIYLPSYADFVRVRNYLATSSATQDISFGSISEYTSVQDVARARTHFLSGRHSLLLYTERAHHFRRYHLKGVKKVVLYGLPENPIFYTEVAGDFLAASIKTARIDAKEANVKALFSKLDVLKLARIVGQARYSSMLTEKSGDTFDFI